MRYDPDRRTTITSYFLRQTMAYSYFTPAIPESVIVAEVMQQLPTNVQSLWAVLPARTLAGAIEFLDRQVAVEVRRTHFRPMSRFRGGPAVGRNRVYRRAIEGDRPSTNEIGGPRLPF